MTEAIKLLFVITLIVTLLRFRWDLGLVMFFSSIILGLLFNTGLTGTTNNIYLTLTDKITIQLIGIVILVYIFSGILNRTGSLDGIISSLQNIIVDYRFIIFFISSFLGLIPMPAGAIFSAPLLKEIGKAKKLSSKDIMFANYWFRHVWEFSWPLLPELILYASIINITLRKIIIVQFPLTVIALAIGFIWMFLNLPKQNNTKINYKYIRIYLLTFIKSVWPILLIIFMVIFFQFNLITALVVVILLLIFVNRFPWEKMKEIIVQDVSIKVIIMIIGIMLFKQTLEGTQSIDPILQLFSEAGISSWVILFFVPFLLGFLTGSANGFVGIGVPVLLPVMTEYGSINLSMAMFSYMAGFVGIMLSPMHLCLTITIGYFKVEIMPFYKKLSIYLLCFVMVSMIYIFLYLRLGR